MTDQRWNQLHAAVLNDEALQERLRATPDWASFVETLLAFAADHNLPCTVADIEAALQARRRSWLERWV